MNMLAWQAAVSFWSFLALSRGSNIVRGWTWNVPYAAFHWHFFNTSSVTLLHSNAYEQRGVVLRVLLHSERCTLRSPYGYLSSSPLAALLTSPFKHRRLKEGPSTECRNKGKTPFRGWLVCARFYDQYHFFNVATILACVLSEPVTQWYCHSCNIFLNFCRPHVFTDSYLTVHVQICISSSTWTRIFVVTRVLFILGNQIPIIQTVHIDEQ